RRLDLEERRHTRHERIGPRVFEQIIASLEVQVAEPRAPIVALPVRERWHAIDHDHVRFRVEIDERGRHADIESLTEIAKRDRRVEAPRGVWRAEVALIVTGA